MRIGLVLTPLNESNLRLSAQIGVTDVVYYDMKTMPSMAGELTRIRDWVASHDLRLSVVEGGPPNNEIVLGRPGRDAEIEHYKRCLDAMGKAGVGVLCYNFMPNALKVARTSYSTPERGGALTSSFDMSRWDNTPVADSPTTDDQMWENLEYFLRRVVPAAEAAEVKLAMHPDDPPLSPMCGLSRIMRSVENFQRLIEIVDSPANGLTMCQGCFSEMGADIPAAIRKLGKRINFVHFRDTAGTLTNFRETFHDNGKTDMLAAMRTYKEIGYQGVMRPDHVPLLEGETGPATGYTMMGRLFAVGYMKGLLRAVADAPGATPKTS
jgi:mannonate dehydratase